MKVDLGVLVTLNGLELPFKTHEGSVNLSYDLHQYNRSTLCGYGMVGCVTSCLFAAVKPVPEHTYWQHALQRSFSRAIVHHLQMYLPRQMLDLQIVQTQVREEDACIVRGATSYTASQGT